MIAHFLKHSIVEGQMPNDSELAQKANLGERTVRQIRLNHGLCRWTLAGWLRSRPKANHSDETTFLCYTPFAGIWLLIPLILKSALSKAIDLLKMPAKCTITAWQLVLTILLWSILNFRRLFHLDDFRHLSNLGLALFTGRIKLLADSTVWGLLHHLSHEDSGTFYKATAAATIDPEDPKSAATISFDDHVVPSFTKLIPSPLTKIKVPTRGRSYPATRLYYHFDLLKKRLLGLTVHHKKLSQVLPELITESRQLKNQAGHHLANKLRIIFDRGGYRGGLFQQLLKDPDLTFITLAISYPNNVKQWEAIPEKEFKPYAPQGEDNPNLKIADTTTKVKDCAEPIRSIVI